MMRWYPLLMVLSLAGWSYAAPGEKATVPRAELTESLAEVKSLFGPEYAKAKKVRSVPQRRKALATLAADILDTYANTTKPADRFALLQVARQIAIQARPSVLAARHFVAL